MKKDIKEYLHFYLGCDVSHEDGTTSKLFSVGIDEVGLIHNDYNQYGTMPVDQVMPILRPLSDMTDEEIDDVWYGTEKQDLLVMEYSDGRNVRKVSLTAERTRYLLSKSFDLFGLIDAGLAIDKTKM